MGRGDGGRWWSGMTWCDGKVAAASAGARPPLTPGGAGCAPSWGTFSMLWIVPGQMRQAWGSTGVLEGGRVTGRQEGAVGGDMGRYGAAHINGYHWYCLLFTCTAGRAPRCSPGGPTGWEQGRWRWPGVEPRVWLPRGVEVPRIQTVASFDVSWQLWEPETSTLRRTGLPTLGSRG